MDPREAPTPSAQRHQDLLAGLPRGLLINGQWLPAADGREFGVEDPADETVLASVADAGEADARAALDAAVAAQPSWAGTAPRERAEILRRAFEAIMERQADLAALMTLEMGKPLAESAAEVSYAAEFFRWFSEEAPRVDGRYLTAPAGDARLLVLRQPVGPCLLITPWNFPLAMGTRKIGPAIAAGCTMIVKPAEQTPLSMLALAGILAECGVPDGVLNVLTTSDPGPLVACLLADPRLRKLSFTGSTEVGRTLVRASAGALLRTSMELGGNAAFLVFADADLEAALEGAIAAKMRNTGEACTAANRFLVEAPVAKPFATALAARLSAMRVGRGSEPGVEVGPLIDSAARAKVERLVADARARGARVLTGGAPIAGPGHFYAPTVLTDVDASSAILAEEVFAPVAPVQVFTTEAEALALANDTPFGLVAYAYTRDLQRALRVADELETGMVGINRGVISNPAAPFGGVKQSGFGREGGREGIEEYLEVKYVALPR